MDMDITSFKEQVTNSLSKFLSKDEITSVDALTPDASSRRYFRINFSKPQIIKNKEINNIVAMLFLSKNSPESGGKKTISSDKAVLELGKFFLENNVSVPTIFFDDLENNIIFTEDLGDLSLAASFQKDKEINYYKKAIDQIKLIQSIKVEKSFFVFNREFGFEQYRIELNEITDYYLKLTQSELSSINKEFDLLANKLSKLDKVLVHRDYHSWNLMVDLNNQLRVIDYQDALMATKYYDLVSLLNDRDTDSILGEDNYLDLLKYYCSIFNYPKDFLQQFVLVALQRDLKVVGRFAKLDKNNEGATYSKWIPGTLNRIARNLNFLNDEFETLKLILEEHCSDNFKVNELIKLDKINEQSK